MMVTVHMFIFFGDSFLVWSSDMIATISMASMDASMYGHKPMMKPPCFDTVLGCSACCKRCILILDVLKIIFIIIYCKRNLCILNWCILCRRCCCWSRCRCWCCRSYWSYRCSCCKRCSCRCDWSCNRCYRRISRCWGWCRCWSRCRCYI